MGLSSAPAAVNRVLEGRAPMVPASCELSGVVHSVLTRNADVAKRVGIVGG